MSLLDEMKAGKVKLVIGDPAQVAALKQHEKAEEEKAKMKTWRVQIEWSGYEEMEIEAATEEEAIEEAKEKIDYFNIDDVSASATKI